MNPHASGDSTSVDTAGLYMYADNFTDRSSIIHEKLTKESTP